MEEDLMSYDHSVQRIRVFERRLILHHFNVYIYEWKEIAIWVSIVCIENITIFTYLLLKTHKSSSSAGGWL